MSTEIMRPDTQGVALSTGDMLAGIERMIRDPNIDPERMEKMFALAERMQARIALENFNRALNGAQSEMPRIGKRGEIINHKTGKLQNRYARYEDIDAEARPIYQRYGFSVTFPGARMIEGKMTYFAILNHIDGHSQEYSIPLALDTSGSKNEVQGGGSTQQYARRYLLKNMFNIVEEGLDTDGNPPQALTDDQVLHLRDLCRETNSAEPRFAAIYGVDSIEKIPAGMYRAAAGVLEQRKAAKR